MQNAWKVGLLVIVFGAMLVGAYAVLNRSIFAKKSTTYYAQFSDAGGVTSGAKVLLAGVAVGTVTDVRLESATKAKLTLAIDEGVNIPKGCTAELPSSLIGIGDRQVQLTAPLTATGNLEPGSTIHGTKQNALQGLIPNAEETVKELNATLIAARKLMEDQDLKRGVKDVLQETKLTIAQFGKLAVKVEAMMAENRGALNAALNNASKVLVNANQLTTEALNFVKDPTLKNQLNALVSDMRAAVAEGKGLVASMNEFINDPQLRDPLARVAANTEKMTESGVKIAAKAEDLVQNGITFSERAIELADKVNGLADDVKEIIERFRGTVQGLPGKLESGRIEANLSGFRELSVNQNRGELELKVPLGQESVHLGLVDVEDRLSWTIQLSKPVQHIGQVRYGIYASKPGLGVDFGITPKLKLRADVFGLNRPRFDARAGFDLGGGLTGYVGLSRIFDKNAPTIGIGIRK